MSEITVATGQLPICPNCQMKHITDFIAHIDPKQEKNKLAKARALFEQVREDIGMNKLQAQDYEKIREVEHKLEDYSSVLRDLRHKIQDKEEGNPQSLINECSFRIEHDKPKQYFDTHSFRVICPECPEKRCALCPPRLKCATRVYVGCAKGHFHGGECDIGVETHKIYHSHS